MSDGTQLFNVRVTPELFDAIEDAAAAEGLRKSVWAREVLGAIAMGGVTLAQLRALLDADPASVGVTPHPSRYLALQGQNARSDKLQAQCSHPSTAVRKLPFTDVCGVCGATLRRR